MNNKIGICFSSEDRSYFLEHLIRRLKDNSRAVFSEIEISPPLHPGSSDRIMFSDFYAIIIIISRHNKDTSWVREALRLVKKQTYTDQHKIIPVIIENCFQPDELPAEQAINLFNHDDYTFELFNIRSLAGLHDSEHLNYNNSIHLLFPNMSEFVNKLFLLICGETISKTFRQPKLIVNTILEELEFSGKIMLERTHGENWMVSKVQHGMFGNILKKSYGAGS